MAWYVWYVCGVITGISLGVIIGASVASRSGQPKRDSKGRFTK